MTTTNTALRTSLAEQIARYPRAGRDARAIALRVLSSGIAPEKISDEDLRTTVIVAGSDGFGPIRDADDDVQYDALRAELLRRPLPEGSW